MIFFQPIILASEFVTHIILIVLIGVMVVEYAARRKETGPETLAGRWTFYRLFLIPILGAVWLIAEFFGVYDLPHLLPARFLIIAAIIAVAGYQMYWTHTHPDHMPIVQGVVPLVFIALFILFDALHTFMPTPIIGLLYALSRITGVVAYYFFIMKYLILNSHETR